MNIVTDEILKNINDGYLVGGAVRDYFLGKNGTLDRDIAIKGAENFAKKLASDFDGTFIVLDSENQIFRVVLKDKTNYFDISELRGETIEDDLQMRDFTINAIAYDLKTGTIIDVTGGIEDIKNKVLRGIRKENFQDDPLRILRAFRFMAVTGFEISKDLEEILIEYLPLALNPAKERINYEIMKLFGGNYSAKTLLKMDCLGLLEKNFPFVCDMKKVPPNSHHHLGLLEHSIETVRQIEILYNEASKEEKQHLDSIDFGGFPRINHLKLSGFLHDIGKFSTWTIEESGRHRFIKHDDVGAKMVIPFLKEMKFSKKQSDYIALMIKNHIYPSNVLAAPDLNEKIMMRYIRKMDCSVIDNIILAKADRLSARGIDITDEIVNNNINGLNKLLNFYLEKKDTLKPLPILLNGNEVMSVLNLAPSPKLGKIMNELHEAQLNGDIITKEDALDFIKKINF